MGNRKEVADQVAGETGVDLLIGEEIGTAKPAKSDSDTGKLCTYDKYSSCYASGHISSYYSNTFIPDRASDVSESAFLRKLRDHGAWGAINHPMSGSGWHCWTTNNRDCRGAADTSAGQVKALEVLTGATDSPQFDRIWRRIGITFSICEMTSLQLAVETCTRSDVPGPTCPKDTLVARRLMT